jgi:hypothetical protein
MKYLFVLFAIMAMVACEKKDENPPVNPPIVQPEPPKVDEFCKADGKQFACMSAMYFYGKECPDGGPVYVKDLVEMNELVAKTGQAVSIKMKDGSLLEIGVGFAMPCEEL